MHFDWSTFALQTVNFVILVWLLQRFLYKPVLRMVDARRAQVDRERAEVDAAKAAAKQELATIAAEREAMTAERAAMLKAAATQAEAAASARRAAAEHEAAQLLDAARKTIGEERSQAFAEARRMASDLAAGLATRVLATVPAPLRIAASLEQVERLLAALPDAERDGLARQVADGGALRVRTAAPLSPSDAAAWRSALQRRLGASVAVVFDVDPELLAGADLHFPNAVLRLSWRSALDALGAELASHGDDR